MSLLSLSGIEASYGPVQALFGVDLSLDEGEVLALMGRNGMGKSTTIKVICRMLRHSTGALMFDGRDIARLPSYKAARAGLGLVPEGRRCFAPLSVRENLISAARRGFWNEAKVYEMFPRLGERSKQAARTLSGGEQQMLAIGRALMTNPRVLILDEATEGLAPVVRHEIWDAIAHLKSETGLALVVVDKSLSELRKVADQAVIIERGKTVWTGDIGKLNQSVADQYLGI